MLHKRNATERLATTDTVQCHFASLCTAEYPVVVETLSLYANNAHVLRRDMAFRFIL